MADREDRQVSATLVRVMTDSPCSLRSLILNVSRRSQRAPTVSSVYFPMDAVSPREIPPNGC
jgi:hypothetical protein